VDGGNIGISFDADWNVRVQKRGHWINPASEAQYAKLQGWLEQHKPALVELLGEGLGRAVHAVVLSLGFRV
jgi:hypothetical protein